MDYIHEFRHTVDTILVIIKYPEMKKKKYVDNILMTTLSHAFLDMTSCLDERKKKSLVSKIKKIKTADGLCSLLQREFSVMQYDACIQKNLKETLAQFVDSITMHTFEEETNHILSLYENFASTVTV